MSTKTILIIVGVLVVAFLLWERLKSPTSLASVTTAASASGPISSYSVSVPSAQAVTTVSPSSPSHDQIIALANRIDLQALKVATVAAEAAI